MSRLLVSCVQKSALSNETYLDILKSGEIIPDKVDLTVELEKIEKLQEEKKAEAEQQLKMQQEAAQNRGNQAPGASESLMYDPISVSTALVSAGGDLLIELTDGTIINAGRVRGNPGPKGDTGDQGIRGAHGKDGIDGTNGAKWHTGVGAPDLDLGVNGDLYMDVAASVLPIYQKVNGSWMFLANLKVAPAGGGGGGSAAPGGDGRPPIIYPPTNPGQQPGTYPGGGALEDGDLWWDPDSGYLYIYLNGEWHPIGERPPVAVQPTPPDYNASGDIDNQYPIVEGDLWFDSDQGALYVAVTNVDGDLVWVITTPADRTILEDEIPTTRYVFPAAADKQIEVNDTTGISYIYNASKNQWIDLPKSPRLAIFPR